MTSSQNPYKIVVKKSKKLLYVYKNERLFKSYPCAHAGNKTAHWTKPIIKWSWGNIGRVTVPDYFPNAWFSFGATFTRYKWPAVGKTGKIRRGGKQYEVKRISATEAQVKFGGKWEDVWKDGNPFGLAGASFPGTGIMIHGSPKQKPPNNHLEKPITIPGQDGCVRVQNHVIRYLKSIIPVGTMVTIDP